MKEAKVSGRPARALHQAGVSKLINNYMIIGPHKPHNRAETCGPPGREKQEMIHVKKFGDLLFGFARKRRVALQHRSSRCVRAIFDERSHSSIAYCAVLRK